MSRILHKNTNISATVVFIKSMGILVEDLNIV